MYTDLDIAEQDLGDPPGTSLSAVQWVESFGCTATPADVQSCPGGTSYRVSGTREQLEALLRDGGYDPDTELYSD